MHSAMFFETRSTPSARSKLSIRRIGIDLRSFKYFPITSKSWGSWKLLAMLSTLFLQFVVAAFGCIDSIRWLLKLPALSALQTQDLKTKVVSSRTSVESMFSIEFITGSLASSPTVGVSCRCFTGKSTWVYPEVED